MFSSSYYGPRDDPADCRRASEISEPPFDTQLTNYRALAAFDHEVTDIAVSIIHSSSSGRIAE